MNKTGRYWRERRFVKNYGLWILALGLLLVTYMVSIAIEYRPVKYNPRFELLDAKYKITRIEDKLTELETYASFRVEEIAELKVQLKKAREEFDDAVAQLESQRITGK